MKPDIDNNGQQQNCKSHQSCAEENIDEGNYVVNDLEVILGQVHLAQSSGNFEEALQLLETTIREGKWKKAKLWWRMVALMRSPSDYQRIRRLWLASPKSCRKNLSILRAVARAACVSNEHIEGRDILRFAIILAAWRKKKSFLKEGGKHVKSLFKSKETKKKETTDPFDHRATHALRDLNEVLEEFGVRTFLISGTLLGFVREGAIISWDKDIDVGVFTEECPDNLEALFRGKENFKVGRIDLNSNRLRITHINKVAIDIFPHYMEGGLQWHDGAATRWWNTPFKLKKVDFLGVEQWVPENPERYLDENYGNWQVPDPFFDARIDAPNVEVTDQDYFDSLLYFGLLKSTINNNQRMKERYIELLRELGETEWLLRI